jgi:hypothetical protein
MPIFGVRAFKPLGERRRFYRGEIVQLDSSSILNGVVRVSGSDRTGEATPNKQNVTCS